MSPVLERMLGRLLRSQRGRDRFLAFNDARFAAAPPSLRVTSASFADGAAMPALHAAADVGGNLSPPIAWSGLPENTAELALVVQDPDAPLPKGVVHCIASGIPPGSGALDAGALRPGRTPPGVELGRGTFGAIGYQGARPILGHGAHRYVFQVFALDRALALEAPDLRGLLAAMAGHVLARGQLVGMFERN